LNIFYVGIDQPNLIVLVKDKKNNRLARQVDTTILYSIGVEWVIEMDMSSLNYLLYLTIFRDIFLDIWNYLGNN